jgi:Uma2 family endonuclease
MFCSSSKWRIRHWKSDPAYKIPLYVKAGIPVAWRVNLQDETIELYAEPAGDIYQLRKTFRCGEGMQAQNVVDLRIEVAAVLG